MRPVRGCRDCAADARFLRAKRRPGYEGLAPSIRIADLFAGGGGLSLGIAETARRLGLGTEIPLAIECDDDAAGIFERNFPKANLVRADVSEVFDGDLGGPLTSREKQIRADVGELQFLLGGPPCQGHSDLNNHTRRRDPRNALYLRAVRAAQVLHPAFVILENVPTIEHDAGEVLAHASDALEAVGYSIAEAILDLSVFGVPQRRKRHILLATLLDSPDLVEVLSEPPRCGDHEARTVQWAIGDLAKITRGTGLDVASVPNRLNRARIQWLIDHDMYDLPNNLRPRCHQGSHSYLSMYGRLRWNAPAQTITTGFGSMGQGRFVHPSLPRTITPHEAARLQTFPDFFDFDSLLPRGTWATVIGNAVPPLLAIHLTTPLVQALKLTDSTAVRREGSKPQRAHKADPLGASTSRRGVPPASSELIRRRMSTTKRRDTGPELALRAELHRLGLRYVVDRPVDGTRGRADVVFVSARVAVYVDGCFWHGCPDHGTVPKQSREWWVAKIEANRRRDADTDARLRAAGWRVLRFWEHDDPTAAARKVLKAVRGPTRDLARTR